ncbi:acetyltransferase, GNAT family [Synechococcus sp. PCC 7335]|uniref:GNAT family N-acetyltransferase n=1 Tax=Synechococcus sp. (strain ATCC 29403 / PCC 7335) TaxID=91464 RepID=UPI00017EE0B4|nr:GNAT family N-acetyltransferase [Synechococcus sp. PCC 7335]EDX85801.1 acetyltransferase, GNAT family [Synechococcus sp. PCC 7335]
MTRRNSKTTELSIRSVHLRDLDAFVSDNSKEVASHDTDVQAVEDYVRQMRRWYGPMKAVALLPSPLRHLFSTFVAEANGLPQGMIQVSPFNRTLSTWKVDRILVNLSNSQAKAVEAEQTDEPKLHLSMDVGSQLLRYCFEHIREAQYWISETDVNDQFGLALYRQNGFQPLARVTYWSIQPEQLAILSERDPDIPNLLPVSNADAQLIYQLETVSIPPLVRQVLDYQIHDFKTTLPGKIKTRFVRWMHKKETVSAYVFEPQRKTAIGYFELKLCRDGMEAHSAKLTVHPAYTWLYPELMAQMAGVVQKFPNQPLRILSLDYQTEREAYLHQIGALEIDHTLMMSRSVWHKVREAKAGALEGLKMPDVLPGLQPTGSPLPGRFSWRGANLGPALDDPSGDGMAWDRFSLEKVSKLSADQRLANLDLDAIDADKEG